ncbi:hypothetical protein BH20CHL6_BH20CHL6_01900 [soil metagenome]
MIVLRVKSPQRGDEVAGQHNVGDLRGGSEVHGGRPGISRDRRNDDLAAVVPALG